MMCLIQLQGHISSTRKYRLVLNRFEFETMLKIVVRPLYKIKVLIGHNISNGTYLPRSNEFFVAAINFNGEYQKLLRRKRFE